MSFLATKLAAYKNDESGAAAVEYGLLLVLMALAIIGAVTTLGMENNEALTSLGDEFEQINANNSSE